MKLHEILTIHLELGIHKFFYAAMHNGASFIFIWSWDLRSSMTSGFS